MNLLMKIFNFKNKIFNIKTNNFYFMVIFEISSNLNYFLALLFIFPTNFVYKFCCKRQLLYFLI